MILAAHIAGGALLKISATGVIFQIADQVAIAAIGVLIAGVGCCCSHGRGSAPVPQASRCETCSDTSDPMAGRRGRVVPRGARWARLDLPDDDYIPVMAIQAVDKERAVDAMDRVRDLLARYRPDINSR